MITKAIIIDKDINSNKYNVRIPYLESSSGRTNYFQAILSTLPGVSDSYAPNDVVLVGFEDHEPDKPIILGKLFIDEERNRGHHDLGSVTVSGTTRLSKDSYVGGIQLFNKLQEYERRISNLESKVKELEDKLSDD